MTVTVNAIPAKPTMVGLVHATVQTQSRVLDYSRFKNTRVICRLGWGYAGGSGTVPPERYADQWVRAMIGTINESRGVWGWLIGNEVNNPTEWPGGYPDPSLVVSPMYFIDLYNRICSGTTTLLSPSSIDPYNVVAQEFGQPGDPRVWTREIYGNARRIGFITLHAKTQGSDPAQCWSDEEFSHAPLIGRKLHLRTVEDQLAWIPELVKKFPVYVTECNPQRKEDGSLGWGSQGAEWVEQACAYLQTQPVDGVCFYRYEDADPWGLENRPEILAKIRELA